MDWNSAAFKQLVLIFELIFGQLLSMFFFLTVLLISVPDFFSFESESDRELILLLTFDSFVFLLVHNTDIAHEKCYRFLAVLQNIHVLINFIVASGYAVTMV